MSESIKHMELVKIIFEYVRQLLPENYRAFIEVDTPSSLQSNYVQSYRPDVFLEYKDKLIIGEAKTASDFDRLHSKSQLDAYIRKCYEYDGDAMLVVSVPWMLLFSVKNHLKRYKQKYGNKVRMIILTDTNIETEI